ncbi:hypothetical protein FRC06_005470 [Ceratobasidium sp. 370]|nr:hypothetical protein FRC06_005470 [Ceratobasidium sp. 370]
MRGSFQNYRFSSLQVAVVDTCQTPVGGLWPPNRSLRRQNSAAQPQIRAISSILDRPPAPKASNAGSTVTKRGREHAATLDSPSSLLDRAKFIPLRLTHPERKLLGLLEAALHVSNYTDRVDIPSCSTTRTKRATAQTQELCSILSGLYLAADFEAGQELLRTRDFATHERWFARVFEIGRRYKIMNPDKMRDTYGKLIYILMDTQSPDIQQLPGFSFVAPIVTVHSTLSQHSALAMLDDPRFVTATREIPTNQKQAEVQEMVKAKERAVEAIVAEYASGGTSGSAHLAAGRATRDEIETDEAGPSLHHPAGEDKISSPEPITSDLLRQCIYSINDHSAFLRTARDPCQVMIGYLKKYFSPTKGSDYDKDGYPSLEIRDGWDGARLSHDHSKQYFYVLQSLTLWKEILENLPMLWHLAESDLLTPNGTYRLENTGQGWNRVQPAPKVSQEMHAILRRVQQNIGSWIGSSVIHIGDHDVPNALFFIDKYCQIYRILLPITHILAQIPAQGKVQEYATHKFGSAESAIREILADFFKHAFDGSGADLYSHAGRCVDGSLTSGKCYVPFYVLGLMNLRHSMELV